MDQVASLTSTAYLASQTMRFLVPTSIAVLADTAGPRLGGRPGFNGMLMCSDCPRYRTPRRPSWSASGAGLGLRVARVRKMSAGMQRRAGVEGVMPAASLVRHRPTNSKISTLKGCALSEALPFALPAFA